MATVHSHSEDKYRDQQFNDHDERINHIAGGFGDDQQSFYLSDLLEIIEFGDYENITDAHKQALSHELKFRGTFS